MNARLFVVPVVLALVCLAGCEEDSSSVPEAETGGLDDETGGLQGETDDTEGETDTGDSSGGPDIGEGVAWPDKSAAQRGALSLIHI